MDIPTNTYNFMIWITKNTRHIQQNLVSHKGVMYFTDRKTAVGPDGGLSELWDAYVKDVLG